MQIQKNYSQPQKGYSPSFCALKKGKGLSREFEQVVDDLVLNADKFKKTEDNTPLSKILDEYDILIENSDKYQYHLTINTLSKDIVTEKKEIQDIFCTESTFQNIPQDKETLARQIFDAYESFEETLSFLKETQQSQNNTILGKLKTFFKVL